MIISLMTIFDFMFEDFKFDSNKKIRLFEAFSGIGTQYMALKRITNNIEVVGISEIDKFAIQSYEAIHGNVKNYGSIGEFVIPKDIDIMTWSFPCQDISLAGKQNGMINGSRSNYGYIFLEEIKKLNYEDRPKILIMENVKALTSKKFEEDYRNIHYILEKLGYQNYGKLLTASDYGIPQTRERIFIISIKGNYNYNFPKPIKLERILKDYLEDKVDDKYYLNDSQIKNILGNAINKDLKDMIDRKNTVFNKKIAYTITTKEDRRIGDSNFILGDGSEEIKVKDYLKIKTNNENTLIYKFKDNDMPRDRIYHANNDNSFTVTTNLSQMPYIMIPEATKLGYSKAYDGDGIYLDRPHQKRGVVQSKKIPTLKTSGNDIGVVIDDEHLKIRKLTPLEAWRLMGISDEDFYKAKDSGISDSQLYKQAGNAIVVDVLEHIFRQLF